jgi:CopG family nickel-responsive transcriptional regulator
MLYNYHGRETLQHIIQVQHDSKVKIIVSQHIHITHDMCLEIITVHGSPPELERLTAALGSIKGVKRASLARAAIAEELK